MARNGRRTRLAALGAVLTTAVVVAGLGAIADDAASVTLEGDFVWERSDGNHEGDLKAVFTPTGDGEWDVAFHFEWQDGPHVYAGTAKGSLTSGALEGEVENDNEERKTTFRFQGSFEDGTFTGTHAAIGKDGELKDTGTLSLNAAS